MAEKIDDYNQIIGGLCYGKALRVLRKEYSNKTIIDALNWARDTNKMLFIDYDAFIKYLENEEEVCDKDE